ncbi:MAG: hypothetical protein RJB01_550 [Actinomycetota bacterium]|jgi:hypothetical protein
MAKRCGLIALGLALVPLAGCAAEPSAQEITPVADQRTTPDAELLDPCAQVNLTTRFAGQLTVQPTVALAAPANKFTKPDLAEVAESEYITMLAEQLGFESNAVKWLVDPASVEEFTAEPQADVLVGGLTAGAITAAGGEPSLEFTVSQGEGGFSNALALAPGNPLNTCLNGAIAALDVEETPVP